MKSYRAELTFQTPTRRVFINITFGPWERIFCGEFDGRRRKRVLVKIVGE